MAHALWVPDLFSHDLPPSPDSSTPALRIDLESLEVRHIQAMEVHSETFGCVGSGRREAHRPFESRRRHFCLSATSRMPLQAPRDARVCDGPRVRVGSRYSPRVRSSLSLPPITPTNRPALHPLSATSGHRENLGRSAASDWFRVFGLLRHESAINGKRGSHDEARRGAAEP